MAVLDTTGDKGDLILFKPCFDKGGLFGGELSFFEFHFDPQSDSVFKRADDIGDAFGLEFRAAGFF